MSQIWVLNHGSKEKANSHSDCHNEKKVKETKERGFNGSPKTQGIGKIPQASQALSAQKIICAKSILSFIAMPRIKNMGKFLNTDF